MGKGYHFNMPTEAKARKASQLFARKVRLNYSRNARIITCTRTGTGRYIASVDVCGAPSDKIDKLAKEITNIVDGEQ